MRHIALRELAVAMLGSSQTSSREDWAGRRSHGAARTSCEPETSGEATSTRFRLRIWTTSSRF